MTTRSELQVKTIKDLRDIAGAVGIEADGLQKAKLIDVIMGAEGFDSADGGPPMDLPETVTKLEDSAKEDSDTGDQAAPSEELSSEELAPVEVPADETPSEEDSGAAIETSGEEPDSEPDQADKKSAKDGGSSRDNSRDGGDRDDGNRNRNRNRNRAVAGAEAIANRMFLMDLLRIVRESSTFFPRDTGFSVATDTCRAKRTFTFRRVRFASLGCARVT